MTSGLGNQRSIQLSYAGKIDVNDYMTEAYVASFARMTFACCDAVPNSVPVPAIAGDAAANKP